MVKIAYIYGLLEPADSGMVNIRYVGKTNDPKDRLYRHRRMAMFGRRLNRFYLWVKSTESKKGNVKMIILEECEQEKWEERERFWIKKLRKTNDLLNICSGGNGYGTHKDETRKRMSEAQLGEKHHSYGKPLSDQQRKKMSKSLKGRTPWNKGTKGLYHTWIKKKHHSVESKQKMSEVHKGKKHTPEELVKMSEAHRGSKNPMFGKHHTEESKKRVSEKLKGRVFSKETRKKISIALKGRPKPASQKEKLRKAMLGKVPWNKGRRG